MLEQSDVARSSVVKFDGIVASFLGFPCRETDFVNNYINEWNSTSVYTQ